MCIRDRIYGERTNQMAKPLEDREIGLLLSKHIMKRFKLVGIEKAVQEMAMRAHDKKLRIKKRKAEMTEALAEALIGQNLGGKIEDKQREMKAQGDCKWVEQEVVPTVEDVDDRDLVDAIKQACEQLHKRTRTGEMWKIMDYQDGIEAAITTAMKGVSPVSSSIRWFRETPVSYTHLTLPTIYPV